MSIKSTQYVTREKAIKRIMEIHSLFAEKNYRELESKSDEPDLNVQSYVDDYQIEDLDLHYWTDDMLTEQLDQPFYRYSMFHN